MVRLTSISSTESAISPIFSYWGRIFVGGPKPSSSTIRVHLYRVGSVDHCVTVFVVFSTFVFFPYELTAREFLGHDARMRIQACGRILFLLP